jgi:hypothetical protein
MTVRESWDGWISRCQKAISLRFFPIPEGTACALPQKPEHLSARPSPFQFG